MILHFVRALALGLICVGVSGCVPTRQEQLESVAKDWSLTIRASQVIPVYPMTEDLLVGDVFLVQRTVQDQHQAYLEKGFLALDNQIARLHPTQYDQAYSKSFFKPGEIGSAMPQTWLTPGEATSFDRAPSAAFPAYTFSVSSSKGFAAALPVQGIPVGLSLMNSDSATGSVTLKDARTYGLPLANMLADVQTWASKPENKELLAVYAGATPHNSPNYLRIVSRVYLVGKVNVSLSDTQASSGSLSVGAPKPVELPLIQAAKSSSQADVNKATTDAYGAGLESINKALEASAVKDAAGNVLPGGTIKVVAAGSKSVSIDETFKRPVVIGYLGFDMAVLPGGELGPPCPTYAVLERNAQPSTIVLPDYQAALFLRDVAVFRGVSAMSDSPGNQQQRASQTRDSVNAAAASVLPATYPVSIWSRDRSRSLVVQYRKGDPVDRSAGAFRAYMSYRDALQGSEAHLAAAADSGRASPEQSDDLLLTRAELTKLRAAYAQIQKYLREGEQQLSR